MNGKYLIHPDSPENETGFLTRLGQYADWMEITGANG